MPEDGSRFEYTKALEDFRRARSKARLQHLWAAVTGESIKLLPYDEISKKMRTVGLSSKGVKEIPMEAIVGSVNRYEDFDRNFLPLRDEDMQRWARVKAVMTSPGSTGLPPIRVYKIGEAYFVLDGNHRVSIAKEMGIDQVEAYVTEIQTRVPITPDDSPEELILKAEYAKFLEETQIDKILPGVDLEVTFPGQYQTLAEHIRTHRHFMGLEQSREVIWEEAVQHWYDHVFHPVIEIIEEQGILEEFPERTATDLYIWVLDHQSYLEKELGWSIRPEKAASDLVLKNGERFFRVIRRTWEKLLRFLLPKQLEDFSSPGEWHAQKRTDQGSLFADILVAMSGSTESWIALEQAMIMAELERSDVRGLIVGDYFFKRDFNEADFSRVFLERLNQSGISGNLAFTKGNIADTICERAKYNDLVILKLSYPPSGRIFDRLRSGMRLILRQSTRPILVVRQVVSPINHLLLAYDGSPKGKEALYVSAYFASRYNKRLTLLVVDNDEAHGHQLLTEAKDYLGSHCVRAVFRKRTMRTHRIILQEAQERNTDLIVMGGYGLSPILEALFGSMVDDVLRETSIPVLVCQ